MRIVVSGTHGSGKSTLVSDFASRHPEFTALPDPFELVDEADDSPGPALFAAQLRIAADRLTIDALGGDLIAERGPLDFLAYLHAEAELAGREWDEGALDRATALVREAMSGVDLLVVLPLTASDVIHLSSDEHLELRDAMNDVLLDLIDDADLVDDATVVVELTGDPAERLTRLEQEVDRLSGRSG